jgi:DNA invertase Pin-like site-specific DNA recombinase
LSAPDTKTTAIYLRISSDDDNTGDSESIDGQRNLLTDFIKSHPVLCDTQIIEAIDDGYSGTNFDRPGVQHLLNLVRRGKVNSIIVKDFSRWGREYIQVGNYLEQLFPFLGIQFISVADDYDSNRPDCGPGDIGVAFKHIMNSYYAKDLSQKIRAVRRIKMELGEFTSPYAIFGYKKSANKRVLEIDEPAASIVQRIFALILQGLSTVEVAKLLNIEGIPTPNVYKQKTGCSRDWNFITKNNIWIGATILRIVTDDRYTGCMITGKHERVEIGRPKVRSRPKEQWFVHEGTHPAIVSKDVFKKVRERIRIHKYDPSRTKREYLLRSKLQCGKCGHILQRSDSSNKIRYICKYSQTSADGACFNDSVDEYEIEIVLRRTIQAMLKTFIGEDEIRRNAREQQIGEIKDIDASLKRLQRDINSLKAKKASLYERYADAIMTQNDYLKQRDACEEQLAGLFDKHLEIKKI